MADKYLELYNKMTPGEAKAAAAWGISASSLLAMSRRGLVDVIDGKPKLYRRKDRSMLLRIMSMLADDIEYFSLYRRNEKLGMLCYLEKGKVFDAFGNPYEVDNRIFKIRIKDKEYSLEEE